MKRHAAFRSQSRSPAAKLARAVSMPFGGISGPVITVAAIFLIIFSSLSPQSVGGIRMGLIDTAAPLLDAVVQPVNKAAEVLRNISGLSELQAENIRLQQENLKLKEWYQTALLLEAENKSLRDLLNVVVEPQYKTISARVLADPNNTFAKSLLVTAGSKNGVKKGQAVMSGDGVIGRVTDVGENTARVLLMSDINSRIPVLIEDTRQHAVLAGYNEDLTKLLHVPTDSAVKNNARVITSGHGGLFPPNLAIGQVQIQKNGVVAVRPFADFTRLTHIRIIDKPDHGGLVEPQNTLN